MAKRKTIAKKPSAKLRKAISNFNTMNMKYNKALNQKRQAVIRQATREGFKVKVN